MEINMKLLLACGAVLCYSGYRLWKHDRMMKEAGMEPIAAALRANRKKDAGDDWSGWESEVDRIIHDSQA